MRGLEEEVKQRLQARATRHGQSMEAEVRDVLKDEGEHPEGSGTRIARRFSARTRRPYNKS